MASHPSGSRSHPKKQIPANQAIAAQEDSWRPSWWKNDLSQEWKRSGSGVLREWMDSQAGAHGESGSENGVSASDDAAVQPSDLDLRNPDFDRDGGGSAGRTRGFIDGRNPGAERGLRYGYGARTRYGVRHADWNPSLETELREEWDRGEGNPKWESVRDHVKYGYQYRRQN